MLKLPKWRWVLLVAFFIGVSIPFLLRAYEKFQLLKTAEKFAYAIQIGDYKTAAKIVLTAEQNLGVTPEAMEKAFMTLQLPPLRLIAVKDLNVIEPLGANVLSFWQTQDGDEVSVILEMKREKGKWKVNFFFTFRRFCSLKLRLRGWEKVKAFQESRPWAMRILKTVGVKGYVSDFGTIRSFEGEMQGIITP